MKNTFSSSLIDHSTCPPPSVAPATLRECFAILDRHWTDAHKAAIAAAQEFELEYAFHDGYVRWVEENIVQRYGLRGEDFFIATDLWHEILLVDEPATLARLVLVEYRRYLLATGWQAQEMMLVRHRL